MAGFTNYANNITNSKSFFELIRDTFLNDGTTNWYTQFGTPIDNANYYKVILRPTAAIDSNINVDIANNGNVQTYNMLLVAKKAGTDYSTFTIYMGDNTQIAYNAANDDIIVAPSTMKFEVFSENIRPNNGISYSYQLSLTSRGWALGFWANSRSNSVTNNCIIAVQRPVNPSDGLPRVSGDAPIFAFWRNITTTGSEFYWGTVREKETTSSYTYGNTSIVSRYNFYKITTNWAHPNVFDNSSHVVKFPYGFSTTRHLYLDEVDLISLVSSASYSSLQDIKITMYGEADERKYRATYGYVQYGGVQNNSFISNIIAGVRIGILYENGGITPTP